MKRYSKGFSLIEIGIALAILGILTAAGVPSLRNWLQTTQIRSEAESIQNGLILTRAEAVRRNVTVRFQFTTSVDSACTISTTASNWVVSLSDPSSGCTTPATQNTGVIQAHNSLEGTPHAVVNSTQPIVYFNGLGRQAAFSAANGIPTPNLVYVDVTNPSGGTCAVNGGNMRCMRVVVTTGGDVKMCDTALPSTDPQGC